MIIRENKCLKCDYLMDCSEPAFEEEDIMPTEGDMTMCLKCGEIMIFNKDLTVRIPNKEERERIQSDPRIMQMQIIRSGIVPDERKKR